MGSMYDNNYLFIVYTPSLPTYLVSGCLDPQTPSDKPFGELWKTRVSVYLS